MTSFASAQPIGVKQTSGQHACALCKNKHHSLKNHEESFSEIEDRAPVDQHSQRRCTNVKVVNGFVSIKIRMASEHDRQAIGLS
jgi:hypothetical protein